MPFVANFPFACILITMVCGIVSSVLKSKNAYRLNIFAASVCFALSLMLLLFMINEPTSITYMMGHYPAPWGNEIRFGPLEALLATIFCFIMLSSLIAGRKDAFIDIKESKINTFCLMMNLLLSSILALIYTNDLFTAYVFIEINTLSACALVMAKGNGRSISSAFRYLIMSLLGSGLFLLSIILLYSVTGHLLMPNIYESVQILIATNEYMVPLTVIIGFAVTGIAVKSALFPFHTWLSFAYESSTCAASSILSGIVSKAYIILLIKIFYRVIGFENIVALKINNVLFVLGAIAMIAGSISAIKETKIKRIVAQSSVSQIGYIFVAMGLGTQAGMIAAVLHMIVHALTKSMLFSASCGLIAASDQKKKLKNLKGAAYRNPIAGIGFVIGALSMIGIPFFAGFASKYYIATASVSSPEKMGILLALIAVSTVLNAIYYVKVISVIYNKKDSDTKRFSCGNMYILGMTMFIVANLSLGIFYQPIVDIITIGLQLF